MSINIRAGLLYNLCTQEYKNIHHTAIQDILYLNKVLPKVVEYSYFYLIRQLFDPGSNKTSPGTKIREKLYEKSHKTDLLTEINYEDIFPKYSHEIIQRFKDLKFNDLEIDIMLRSFLDLRDLCASANMFVVDKWKYSDAKPGIRLEKTALANLCEIGFEVSEGKHDSICIEHGGIKINLNGRPDGVIRSSPGNVYAPGTLIEIKYKPNGNNSTYRDEMQLCAYGVIFNVDVLYVVIQNHNYMTCTLYKKEELHKIWNDKKDIILKNSHKLQQLIEHFDNDTDAEELINLAIKK